MNINTWWQDRLPREKLALTICAAILLFTIIYLVIEPVIKERQRLRAELPQLREDLVWMQAQLDEIQLLQNQDGAGTADSGQPLTLALVEDILGRSGLDDQVSELRPLAEGAIRLGFDEIVHADLMELLYQLRRDANAGVSQAAIRRLQDQDGVVEANLTLSMGSG